MAKSGVIYLYVRGPAGLFGDSHLSGFTFVERSALSIGRDAVARRPLMISKARFAYRGSDLIVTSALVRIPMIAPGFPIEGDRAFLRDRGSAASLPFGRFYPHVTWIGIVFAAAWVFELVSGVMRSLAGSVLGKSTEIVRHVCGICRCLDNNSCYSFSFPFRSQVASWRPARIWDGGRIAVVDSSESAKPSPLAPII